MNDTGAIVRKYDSVFAQATFQTAGHLDEYLIRHTHHLALLYFQTRLGTGGHVLRRYEEGVLVEESPLRSAKSILGYYWLWWWHWFRSLNRFRKGRRRVIAICMHPIAAIGMGFQRNVYHVFWQWDYFPGGTLVDRLFNACARFYAYACDEYHPLTASIGKAMGKPNAQVIMLGMNPPRQSGDRNSSRFLMVGQLRPGQGIEAVLEFLADNRQYELSLVGGTSDSYAGKIRGEISRLGLQTRVCFWGRFVSEEELRLEATRCFAAIALYDLAQTNLTHYADPGKVKSAIELGLPVIMTRISDIAPVVESYGAGIVIDSLDDLPNAIREIRASAGKYMEGCRRFAEHFNCETYYP